MKEPLRLDSPAGAPPAFVYLSQDPILGETVRAAGPQSVTPSAAFFPRFIQSIVRQQISMDAADAIFQRLENQVALTPTGILHADPTDLRDAGLSGRKIETIQAVADAFETRQWDVTLFEEMTDEDVIAELTTIRGVGVWTAKMQLVFSLGRPDVFPIEDLGVRRGMTALLPGDPSRDTMERIARRWQPYRSMAAMYLWAVQDQ